MVWKWKQSNTLLINMQLFDDKGMHGHRLDRIRDVMLLDIKITDIVPNQFGTMSKKCPIKKCCRFVLPFRILHVVSKNPYVFSLSNVYAIVINESFHFLVVV